MDTYCDFTELPTLSCAHCSGVEDVLDPIYLDYDYQTGRLMEFRAGGTKAQKLSEPVKDPAKEIQASLDGQTEGQRGRWNKTREVYGGNDSQADFEDIEKGDGK